MSKHEQPTDDLRQVKRPIKRSSGVCGPGHYEETIGYDTTVQRRWIVRVGGADAKTVWKTDSDGGKYPDYETRSEWRDLDTIWTEKPRMRNP